MPEIVDLAAVRRERSARTRPTQGAALSPQAKQAEINRLLDQICSNLGIDMEAEEEARKRAEGAMIDRLVAARLAELTRGAS